MVIGGGGGEEEGPNRIRRKDERMKRKMRMGRDHQRDGMKAVNRRRRGGG